MLFLFKTRFQMKIAAIMSALILISFNSFAGDITGDEAQKKFDQLNKYEYSAAAITNGIEYRLTVRHDDVITCQKEETKYPSSEVREIEYSCKSL
jgi:hypothetical protein